MKTFFKKHWYLITFAFTVLLDMQNDFLQTFVKNEKIIYLIRFIGMIVLAYKFNTRNRVIKSKTEKTNKNESV
jgi:hypothetical protein